jgi:hypothetical protein
MFSQFVVDCPIERTRIDHWKGTGQQYLGYHTLASLRDVEEA